jgi:2-polyprenyl-3-methyl-5-hydroxy-6-metoxy-1,4-benzoquinol methylase
MRVATQKGACPLCGIDYPGVELARGPDFEYRTTGDQEFRLMRCTGCGTIVLDPRPVDDVIASLYPPEYEPYRFEQLNPIVKAGRDFVQRRKTRLIERYAPAGGTIVDVGCGGGALLRLLRAETAERYHLIGWDYPGPHLDTLSADGIETIAAALDSASAPADVDVFVLNQVIEHVPHPDRLLEKLARSLRPGGHVIIETPNARALDAGLFSKRYWGGYHIPRHMVLFDDRNLPRLVERIGLRVVEQAQLASPAFWVQSLHHRLTESPLASLAPICVIRNAPLVAAFAAFDVVRARVGATGNQRVVARRDS